MDVTLVVNRRDFAPRLSTYDVRREVTYGDIITTMDGVEHLGRKDERYIVAFSVVPYNDAMAQADYTALASGSFSVTFTDSRVGDVTREMRVASDLNSVFGLRSVDGNRYYKGGEITLRALMVESVNSNAGD